MGLGVITARHFRLSSLFLPAFFFSRRLAEIDRDCGERDRCSELFLASEMLALSREMANLNMSARVAPYVPARAKEHSSVPESGRARSEKDTVGGSAQSAAVTAAAAVGLIE